jgi:NADPH-dependent 2,4-dienoyl-CoA reductase/sulfur reductase-like enzyme
MPMSEESYGNPAKPDADVIVVGAGPAGMSAAIDLAHAGCSVIVLDMQPAPGGQIYRGIEANLADEFSTGDLLPALGPAYTAGIALVRRFRAASSIEYRPQTTVWEVRPDGTVGWLCGDRAGYLRARHVLLANGAMERPVPFPGWTLPGVMTAGAVQTLLKVGRLKPAGQIVLAGTGPLILLLADQMRRLGVRPHLIARTDRLADALAATRHLRPGAMMPLAKGLGWLVQSRLAGVKFVSGISQLEAAGKGKVESVSYSVGNERFTHSCDLLVVHDGIVPSIDLAHGAGLALEWDPANASWRPKTSVDGSTTNVDAPGMADQPCKVRVTGDARRIGGADAAVAHGKLAAAAVLADLGKASLDVVRRAQTGTKRALAARPFLDAAFPPGLSAHVPVDDTIVCRCEELTAGVLRAKIEAGTRDLNLLRAETRCGMGPCQGRSCMITVSRMVADGPVRSPLPLPVYRARPPVRPLPLGALANLIGLDPEAAEMLALGDKPDPAAPEDCDVQR